MRIFFMLINELLNFREDEMNKIQSSVYLILLFILFITLGNVHTIALGHVGSHNRDLQFQEEKQDHHGENWT